MAAQHHRLDILDGDVQRLGEEGAVARRVEHTGHADHPLAREPCDLLRHPAHHVERVRHHDDDRLWAVLLDLLRDLLHDVGVSADQVVAAHAGLARDPRRNDHELAPRRRGVVVGADHARVESFDRRRLPLVEGFALGHALDHVDEDDAPGELLFGQALGGGGADVAGADDRDLLEHAGILS